MLEQLLTDIIIKVFTSKEMQEYLCENINILEDWHIAEIVGLAKIPKFRKRKLFKELNKHIELSKDLIDTFTFINDLNIPVPFKPGDIIACDRGYNYGETKAVILRIGDNRDCCSLVAMCDREDGTYSVEPVKHTNMFFDIGIIDKAIPPLYTARRISRAQCGEYSVLCKISDFVNGNEDKGYIVEKNCQAITMNEVTKEWFEFLEKDYLDYQDWISKRELKV